MRDNTFFNTLEAITNKCLWNGVRRRRMLGNDVIEITVAQYLIGYECKYIDFYSELNAGE